MVPEASSGSFSNATKQWGSPTPSVQGRAGDIPPTAASPPDWAARGPVGAGPHVGARPQSCSAGLCFPKQNSRPRAKLKTEAARCLSAFSSPHWQLIDHRTVSTAYIQ